jgi:tetratricopeptide (TPR) repeat protein
MHIKTLFIGIARLLKAKGLMYLLLPALTAWPQPAFSTFHAASDSLHIEELTMFLRNTFRSGDYEQALLMVDSIKVISKRAGMKHKLADCEANYGLIKKARGNLNESVAHYLIAGEKYRQLEDDIAAAKAFTAAGQILTDLQQFNRAYECFHKSFQLREMGNDSLGMVNNLINMGGTVYFTGELADASEYFYRALRMIDRIENPQLKATTLMNISTIHTRQKNYGKAIEYLEQALQIARRLKEHRSVSDILLNLGIAYYESDQIDEAERYFNESLKIKESLMNDVSGMIKLSNNLGLIAKEKGDDKKAIYYFSKTIDLARMTGDTMSEAIALNNLGSRLMMQHDEGALAMLEKSLNMARQTGLKNLELANFDNLHQLHANKGNYQEAYAYLMRFKQLNDSVFNKESAARIADLQIFYDAEIKEQENLLLKDQARIMRMRLILLSISAVAIAMAALSFWVLFQQKRKSLQQSERFHKIQQELLRMENEKSEQQNRHLKDVLFAEEEINRLQLVQLQEKDRELSTSTLHILNKNEVLINIRKLAQKALQNEICEGQDCIRHLIREVDNNLNLDEQWEQFKKHFESVHTGFFAHLIRRYPALSQNELKLCAYLRMNLSSKEIAQMLNIEMDSANTKRYRLRKKLGLETDDNLLAFLMQF